MMFSRLNHKLVIIKALLLVMMPFVDVSNSESLRADILQQKAGRLYFSSGENELVLSGNSFTIYCGNDSIYSGTIEFSHQEISYSNTLTLDSADFSECEAVIETASIDSTSTITIGCLKSIGALALLGFDSTTLELTSTVDSLKRSRHKVRVYNSPLDMELDLEQGKIDAVLSYVPITSSDLRSTKEIAAPFIAALWPNVSSKANRDALLTTSMIYRYDSDSPERYFQGDNVNRLASQSPDPGRYFSKRYYPYDPQKGADLARLVRKKSKSVNIHVLNPELTTLAEYFADLLSRDRLRTQIVEKADQADAYFGMVSFRSDDPLLTMASLIERLNQIPNTPRKIREQLELAADNIASARSESETEQVEYFANLARNRLIEDLGVFPLFRPSIFFTSSRHIQGLSYDSNGIIDLSNLIKLIPPERPEADQ